LQEKVQKLLKHNRELNSPKANLTYDSRLVEIKCYARKDGCHSRITSKECYVGITNIGNILVLIDYRKL